MFLPTSTHFLRHAAWIVLVLFGFSLAAQQGEDWVLKNEKDAVKVYYRKNSGIYELKLATSIKVPLSGIVQLFDEVSKYPVWGYKVIEARLLKRVSPTEVYYYSKIDFPWPMNDRDIVLHTKLEQDLKNHAVYSVSTAAPDYIPEIKDVVRIRQAKSKWTMVPGNGGWLYVEYYLNSDPGGNIPDWAINLALDVGPRETIKRMREILKEPFYQNSKLAHIKEKE
ncbi:MAG: START domain-containing protein [Saprospiraceae bacterium]|nr:START domain-containing protein [Saprospiraceae bacterium]